MQWSYSLLTFILSGLLSLPVSLFSQHHHMTAEGLPEDYLPASFHYGRREALRNLMPDSSVAVIFAYPTRNFSNDVEYNYHPNPDLYYFSGYREPHSLLIVFKEPQTGSDGSTYNELLFVQKKNAQAEQWTGKRLGVEGAREKLGFTHVYNGQDFKNFPLDLSRFRKILHDRIPADIANGYDKADLWDLADQFRQKLNPASGSLAQRADTRMYLELTGKLRRVKTPEELNLLRKAVEISCQAHNEVMKAVHPGMSELEIQGLQEYVHKKQGAEGVGYGSIVGAGENGCVLHYTENSKTRIGESLLLMDVGAEYHGYTADVTRTIPASGKFTREEKEIYQLVYEAQEAAFRTLRNGSKFSDASHAARETIADGLLKLGVIKNKSEATRYYPHGLGHHIGLDVHDRGSMETLLKDMVITIEPGIYIQSGSDCDKKWWGIAVRIEDDVLITENGYELLSRYSPRKADEVEKMISQKSALDDFRLPELESRKKKAF